MKISKLDKICNKDGRIKNILWHNRIVITIKGKNNDRITRMVIKKIKIKNSIIMSITKTSTK